jgi:cation:H+ antiporter
MLIERPLLQRCEQRDARVVDPHVDPTVRLERGLRERVHVLLTRHVGDDCLSQRAVRSAPLGRLLEGVAPARREHDRVVALRKLNRELATKSARCAGDYHHASALHRQRHADHMGPTLASASGAPDGAPAPPSCYLCSVAERYAQLPLLMHVLVFAAASGLVWYGGTRLTLQAKQIAERTGMGDALVGSVLLGGVASLPELVMSVTAAARHDAQLALSTLLGGVPVTLAMVAVVDAWVGGGPVSTRVTRPIVLLQGAFLTLLLALLGCALVTGDRALAGAGVGSAFVLVAYVALLAIVRRQERDDPWLPTQQEPEHGPLPLAETSDDRISAARLALTTCGAGAVTFVAGYALSISGHAIAEGSGLGSTLVGLVLGGIATSLPELSMFHTAARLHAYEMAFGDAFGSSMFSLALIYLCDLAYPGVPILNKAGASVLLATLLGVLTTCIYLAGLVQRSRRTVVRLGFDSVLALLVYAVGLVFLYRLA